MIKSFAALFLSIGLLVTPLAVLAKKADTVSSATKLSLPANIKIKTMKRGKGANPSPSDTVLLNYEIFAENGESLMKARWQMVPVNEALGGLSPAITHMQKGGQYEVTLPAEHAFGIYSPAASIPPNSAIRLKVDILDFGAEADATKTVELATLQPDVLRFAVNQSSVTTEESGLKFKTLVAGTGDRPGPTDTTLVGYEGRLLNGTIFDSNEEAAFPVSRVVPGFGEALQLMQKGGRYRIWIPPALGYGERATGSIPANSWLIFDVTLKDFISEADMRKLQQQR